LKSAVGEDGESGKIIKTISKGIFSIVREKMSWDKEISIPYKEKYLKLEKERIPPYIHF